MGGPEEPRECPFVRHCHCPFLFRHFEFLGRGQRRACPRRLAPCARGSLPHAARGSASPGCRLTPTPARAPIYSIRQHTSACVSIRQHAAGGWSACCGCLKRRCCGCLLTETVRLRLQAKHLCHLSCHDAAPQHRPATAALRACATAALRACALICAT